MSYALGINNIHFDATTCDYFFFKGNKTAVIQGQFPASTMKVVFKEGDKELATYFNTDGAGICKLFRPRLRVFRNIVSFFKTQRALKRTALVLPT